MNEEGDPRETLTHPRHSRGLVGHADAEAGLLAASNSGKLHHAWLLAGPRGIGKVTLAYRFARFLLARPGGERRVAQTTLDVNPDHQASHLIAARAHPDLMVIERGFDRERKRLKAQIVAEDARAAPGFFSMTPAMGGYRVCLVDAADDLNPQSANALLLKILEEPPRNSVFLLVAHAPGRLLPTIRSRAVALNLLPLPAEDVVSVLARIAPDVEPGQAERAASLSGGSPGRALELLSSAGARLFVEARPLFGDRSLGARQRLFEIANGMLRSSDELQIFSGLLSDWLAGQGRAAALSSDSGTAATWARLAQDFGHSIREANTLNLDRRQLLNEAFDMIEQVPGRR